MTFESSESLATFVSNLDSNNSFIENGIQVSSEYVVQTFAHKLNLMTTDGPVAWGMISLPYDSLPSFQQPYPIRSGRTESSHIARPSSADLESLRRVHRAAELLAREAPELLDDSRTVRSLADVTAEALIRCLEVADIREDRSAHRRHGAIMRRFHRVLEDHIDQPIYVLEMAKLVGASLRTLSVCCQDYLGMGPKRYLTLRRMNLARHALRAGSSTTTSVTEVATQYGFWQFGRFSGDYKALFGELPSVTLSRPTE
jgi:AraC-like DNA-binding protein